MTLIDRYSQLRESQLIALNIYYFQIGRSKDSNFLFTYYLWRMTLWVNYVTWFQVDQTRAFLKCGRCSKGLRSWRCNPRREQHRLYANDSTCIPLISDNGASATKRRITRFTALFPVNFFSTTFNGRFRRETSRYTATERSRIELAIDSWFDLMLYWWSDLRYCPCSSVELNEGRFCGLSPRVDGHRSPGTYWRRGYVCEDKAGIDPVKSVSAFKPRINGNLCIQRRRETLPIKRNGRRFSLGRWERWTTKGRAENPATVGRRVFLLLMRGRCCSCEPRQKEKRLKGGADQG